VFVRKKWKLKRIGLESEVMSTTFCCVVWCDATKSVMYWMWIFERWVPWEDEWFFSFYLIKINTFFPF